MMGIAPGFTEGKLDVRRLMTAHIKISHLLFRRKIPFHPKYSEIHRLLIFL
jgi:hypothetical protein